ncbi:OmpP1/FadL family transporter [candidate division KSB1 bacterium]
MFTLNASGIRRKLLYVTVVFTVVIMLSASVFASNGYFAYGWGTKSKGMAGVGMAIPLSSLAAASNPAGMVFVGNKTDLSVSLFNPNREYTVIGNPPLPQNTPPGAFPLMNGTIESGRTSFFIPGFGINRKIDSSSSIGFSLFGNGGMNTEYDTKTFNNPMVTVTQPTGVNLSQLFAGITYARKLNDNHAIGITGIAAYQMFKAQGLQAFAGFSSSPQNLTDNDSNSFGFGARFGYMGKLSDKFSVGAAYQTKLTMGEFEEYAGLFAEQGGFDIPSNWSVGIALNATEQLTLGFDLQTICYSKIKSIANPMLPNLMMAQLGADGGPGFGWEDMTVYKFGGQYMVNSGLTLRAGYSFGKQPIPESEMMFNILAPGVIEQHITFGLSKMVGTREIDFAVMRALSSSITGPNALYTPQNIELKMNQWEFELGISF